MIKNCSFFFRLEVRIVTHFDWVRKGSWNEMNRCHHQPSWMLSHSFSSLPSKQSTTLSQTCVDRIHLVWSHWNSVSKQRSLSSICILVTIFFLVSWCWWWWAKWKGMKKREKKWYKKLFDIIQQNQKLKKEKNLK